MHVDDQQLLTVYKFDKKRRLGRNEDGGYVIGILNGSYDCYISCGVSSEEGFTRDFIDKYDMERSNSFAFDGTIDDFPWNYTRDITFIKKNIGAVNDNENSNMSFLTEKYNDIFMKIDIEGGEFPWIMSVNADTLNKFKQIVIEVHGINSSGWGSDYETKIACLKKLSDTHYIIHAHANNNAPVQGNIPDVMELTYIRKNYFLTPPQLNTYPLPDPIVDFRCNPTIPDIYLNTYPFVHATSS
jgi:hypothetical protein